MDQADSVHSTPPTNTSVTRRRALGTSALIDSFTASLKNIGVLS